MEIINVINNLKKAIFDTSDSEEKKVEDNVQNAIDDESIDKSLEETEKVNENELDPFEWLGLEEREKKVTLSSEATYFICLKILSESIGKLPFKIYKRTDKGRIPYFISDINRVLTIRPNEYMNPTIFWSTVELNRNNFGNAYIWCRWQGRRLKDIWIMQSDCVEVYIDNMGYFGQKNKIYYIYSDPKSGKRIPFKSEEVIHLKTSYTYDGIIGLPVRAILRSTIEGNLNSQIYMNKLYKEGLTGSAVLQYTGDLDKKAQRKLKAYYEEFSSGPQNAGKIIPVPLGMTLQPLNYKLTDAQFFELKKYSSLQIAAAFGIKPNHINNYEKSSYSNSEMQQLSFYTDTLQYIMKQYEEEITYKLLTDTQLDEGIFIKFNERAILRADSKTQMEVLTSYSKNGIYTANEARDYLDMPWKEGGDALIVNGNCIPIDDVGKQYDNNKGGENNE